MAFPRLAAIVYFQDGTGSSSTLPENQESLTQLVESNDSEVARNALCTDNNARDKKTRSQKVVTATIEGAVSKPTASKKKTLIVRLRLPSAGAPKEITPLNDISMPAHMEKKMKAFIDNADWDLYHGFIIKIMKNGHKTPRVRRGEIGAGKDLKDFIEKRHWISRLHNDYVREYNAVKPKETQHLPAFPELELEDSTGPAEHEKAATANKTKDDTKIDTTGTRSPLQTRVLRPEPAIVGLRLPPPPSPGIMALDRIHRIRDWVGHTAMHRDQIVQVPDWAPRAKPTRPEPAKRHPFYLWVKHFKGNDLHKRPTLEEIKTIAEWVNKPETVVNNQIFQHWFAHTGSLQRNQFYQRNAMRLMGGEAPEYKYSGDRAEANMVKTLMICDGRMPAPAHFSARIKHEFMIPGWEIGAEWDSDNDCLKKRTALPGTPSEDGLG